MTAVGDLDYYQIVFPKLGIDINVKSEAFSIFGIPIQWYGVIITVGIILAMLFGLSQMKKYGLDSDKTIDVIIGGIFGGIIGARAYYVIMEWENYAGDWKKIFNIRSGGLAIYGGIIGAVLVALVISKIRKVRILPLLDIAGMGFLIGQAIGRWGNFFNHEAFGCNTDSVFGMSSGKIQQWIESNNATLSNGAALSPDYPVHPCFLYESVWCLIGFLVIFAISKKARKFDGQLALMYVVWYGLGRFFIEGLRTDSLMIGSFRVSQVLSAAGVIAALALLVFSYIKVKKMGNEYKLYCDTEESKQMLLEAQERNEKYRLEAKKKKAEKQKDTVLEIDEAENYSSIISDDEDDDNSDNDNDNSN